MSALRTLIRRPFAPELLTLALATALLTLELGDIPGLHCDEAWVILRVHRFLAGEGPVAGMNYYAGALNQWLAMPLLALTQFAPAGLRLVGGLANLAAALLTLRTLRRLGLVV